MTNKPYRRRAKSTQQDRESVHGALAKLFDIEPYHRNELNLRQLNRLREMIDMAGAQNTAERIGVHPSTLLYACAGFGHKLKRKTTAKLREFLNGKESK